MKRFIRSKIETLPQFSDLAREFGVGIEFTLSINDLLKGVDFRIFDGLELTVHAPFFDVNIVSHNPFVMKKSVSILKDTFEFCNNIDVINIVIHHNYSPFVYNFDEDYYTNKFVENFHKVLEKRSGEYSITFENVFEVNSSIGKRIVDSFRREYIGLCFDCGHFNLFSEISLEKWLGAWGDSIFEMHIHNNYGYRDDHNSLPDGVIDIRGLLQLYEPKFLTIENRNIEDTKRSLEFIRKF